MKLILIHGNALVAISSKIATIKSSFDSLSTTLISGKERGWDQMIVDIGTPDLFAQDRLILLEDYDEKNTLEKLPQNENLTIVIRFNKLLPVTSVLLKEAVALKAEVILLTERDERTIFPFLDLLGDKNSRAMEQVDLLLSEYGGQYLLIMIFYLLRRNILASKNASSFSTQRVEKQKKNFPQDRITKLYKRGLELDYKIKSGAIEEKMALTLFINDFLS